MKGKYVFLIVLYALSVVVRIYPVFVTPIPYNADALRDARASQYIGDHGNLNFPQNVSYNNHHTPVTIFFNALCGAIFQMTGVNVLQFIPYLFPFLTSIGILGWYLLAKRITKKEEIAALTAAMFAVGGVYVDYTALIWKQALGMTIMPFILYTYKKRNWISLFLLILLPLIHHYVALITYLIITYDVLYTLYLKHHKHERFVREDKMWFLAVPILWGYFTSYYTTRHFDRLNEISPGGSLWLFISIFVVIYLISLKIFSARYRGIKFKYYLLISSPPILLYVAYFFYSVFPHTMKFNFYTFAFTIGYFLLLPLIVMGMALLFLTEHKNKSILLSSVAAPVHMLLFFFLRGFELESYASLSRTVGFADLYTHTSASTSAYTFKHRIVAFSLVFVLIATTTPLTYFSEESFGVSFFIHEDEYHAAQWIKDHFPDVKIESDDKLTEVANNSFDITSSRMLPYELENGIEPQYHLWLVGSYWKNGAQMSPMAPIKVDVNSLLAENSVIFSTGNTYVVLNGTVG